MTKVAIHTEIFNDDGSLAGYITWTRDDDDHFTVRSNIPEEGLDITQSFPYDSYAAARYAVMIQKVKVIAQRNKVNK